MRGSDPIIGRVRLALWAGLVLLVANATARAQDASGEVGVLPQLADPIDLRADRILTWEARGRSWAVLDGDAAAFLGSEGVRARRAVVRYGPDPDDPRAVRAEVYAEGDVELPGDRRKSPSGRKVLSTLKQVVLRPFAAGRVTPLTAPPTSGWEAHMLHSAFPEPVVAAAPSPAPAPAPSAPEPETPDSTQPVVVSLGEPIAEPGPPTPAGAEPAPPAVATSPSPGPDLPPLPDPGIVKTQFEGPGFDEGVPAAAGPGFETDPLPELDPLIPQRESVSPPAGPPAGLPGDELPALEGFPDLVPAPEAVPAVPAVPVETNPLNLPNVSPIMPGSQRVIDIRPRNGGDVYNIKSLPKGADGTETYLITGGVNVVINSPPPRGTTDLSADSVVIWKRSAKEPKAGAGLGPQFAQDQDDILEFYLEGNVVIRTDDRVLAGQDDQKTYQAAQAYYDARLKRFLGLDAELAQFSPGLIMPLRIKSPKIQQFTDLLPGRDGRLAPIGSSLTRADQTMTTGSRFPYPGYRFNSRSVDITEQPLDPDDPRARKPGRGGRGRRTKQKLIEARQNFFYMGAIPVFYWPKMVIDPDDPTPPLQNLRYMYSNYFGQMILTDWNGFKLFNLAKPDPTQQFVVDTWNVDLDYLTLRGPAVGTEFAYFGEQLFRNTISPHFGYFNGWGIHDTGLDVLGGGPALVPTSAGNPLNGVRPDQPFGPGRARYDRSAVPSFNTYRGKVDFKEMMQILPQDAALDEDLRVQVELGYVSDRNFLEEYYKRVFDVGLDEETLAYGIRQRQNHALTIQTEANLQNWVTDTQWLPKLSYYRLGDSLLADRLTYFTNSGADYAVTHSAIEVGNANMFAFLPTDPATNTGRAGLSTGRYWTSHELDAPIQLGVLKVTPYVQGQLVGWDDQLGGGPLGRYMGAAGGRASAIAWRKYSGQWTESELLNIHGLNHKIQFDVDARFAYANQTLDRIGVQDDLDDNTYEFVRRYFAMSQFTNAILPPQYDPRHLLLRRAISPITGSTDIQGSMDTIRFAVNQRLQTRRGPEGKRRVVDYMVFDMQSTYFPDSSRDNFDKPFGQTMYNYEWYVGDRTSITSTGWFEFFDITGGKPLYSSGNPQNANNPFQTSIITAGVSKNLPPRATAYAGYSIINTGPINTSALNLNSSYLLSPKWYMTFATMYDFGNKRWLSASFSVTKIGSDFLTSVGFNADPQRQNVTAGIQITPRISPNIRLGSASGLQQIDTRFAPTQ